MGQQWECIHEDTEDQRIHALPVNDDLIHIEGMQCPCDPEFRSVFVYDRNYLACRGQVIHNWVGDDDSSSETNG